MTDEQTELLREWLERLRDAQKVHYRMGHFLRWWYLIIGLPIVIFSCISAFLAFGLPIVAWTNASIWAGVGSMIVAVLASIQTFLRLNELADAHVKAAKGYANLKVELEHVLAFPPPDGQMQPQLDDFRRRWEVVNNDAPEAPGKLWADRRKPA